MCLQSKTLCWLFIRQSTNRNPLSLLPLVLSTRHQERPLAFRPHYQEWFQEKATTTTSKAYNGRELFCPTNRQSNFRQVLQACIYNAQELIWPWNPKPTALPKPTRHFRQGNSDKHLQRAGIFLPCIPKPTSPVQACTYNVLELFFPAIRRNRKVYPLLQRSGIKLAQ